MRQNNDIQWGRVMDEVGLGQSWEQIQMIRNDYLHVRSKANRIGAIYRFCHDNMKLRFLRSTGRTVTRTMRNKNFPNDLGVSHTFVICITVGWLVNPNSIRQDTHNACNTSWSNVNRISQTKMVDAATVKWITLGVCPWYIPWMSLRTPSVLDHDGIVF